MKTVLLALVIPDRLAEKLNPEHNKISALFSVMNDALTDELMKKRDKRKK